jgi:diguanylate cyclase (GGDEF)-like protein
VVERGKAFHQSARAEEGDLKQRITRTQPAVSWAFPIVRGHDVVGVVTVAALGAEAASDINLLKLTAGLITEQWTCVAEICRARVATVTDPATGLATRAQFLQQAPLLLNQARRLARPVTAAAFSIEGLRRLDDEGLWGLRDQAVASVAKLLRRHVRAEDYASRFDDSRFVVLWQAAEGDEARGAASEIVSDLHRLFGDRQRWPQRLHVRCGTASTRQHADNLGSLLSTAILNSLKHNGDGDRSGELASAGLADSRECSA